METPRDHAKPLQVPHFTKQYDDPDAAKLQKLDWAELAVEARSHDERMMQSTAISPGPLEKVPCQLAEEFKVRLKTALTQCFSETFPNFNMVKMLLHDGVTPRRR